MPVPGRVGHEGRSRLPVREGQAQVHALRVLNDDVRTFKIQMFGQSDENVLKGGVERLARGQHGDDPAQSVQIPGKRAVLLVHEGVS